MRRAIGPLVLGAGAAAVAAGVRQYRSTNPPGDDPGSRSLVVTVNRPVDEVAPGGVLPERLRDLEDEVEVDVRPAPGGKGTELALRPKQPTQAGPVGRLAGRDPRQRWRAVLRETKSVLECGEVVQADEPGSTERTVPGALLDRITSISGGEGRL